MAKGTYKPSFDYGLGGGSRYYRFRMKNGVTIYGGFAGTETAVSQRTDFRAGGANETILSGDLNGDDVITGAGATLSFSNNGENCYHVFYHPAGLGLTTTAVLDGFSITGGNANGTNPHNWGGGISNFTASVSLNNVSIYNNFSAYIGGGISNLNSSPVITNFSMRFNSSLYGAMYSNVASPVMINGLISDNKGESNVVQVIMNPVYAITENIGICEGESLVWHDSTYATTGTHMAIYKTNQGCDSTFTLSLTVNAVDISVVQNGNTLTAGVAGAGYRWMNCADDYSLLPDETNQNFNPAADGLYAVEITQNNCVDTSDCYSLSLTGIDPLASTEIKLYPTR